MSNYFEQFKSTARPSGFNGAWDLLLAEHATRFDRERREARVKAQEEDAEDEFPTKGGRRW
jgi:hypothetical protein